MMDLMTDVLSTLAFAAVGMGVLVAGYYMVDLVTPGRLGHHVFVARNRDAALVLASSLLALGMIVAMAIWVTTDDDLMSLVNALVYGLLGVALLAISLVVLDLVTPGRLGEIIADEHQDPAVWVAVATQLTIGLIVVASLS